MEEGLIPVLIFVLFGIGYSYLMSATRGRCEGCGKTVWNWQKPVKVVSPPQYPYIHEYKHYLHKGCQKI